MIRSVTVGVWYQLDGQLIQTQLVDLHPKQQQHNRSDQSSFIFLPDRAVPVKDPIPSEPTAASNNPIKIGKTKTSSNHLWTNQNMEN